MDDCCCSKTKKRSDEEYKKLAEEYQKIQEGDTSYLQRTARVKYNMVKPGEIEFRTAK